MGMDIYGLKPKNDDGKYFRANIWTWRPIHRLCEKLLNTKLPGWGYNNGAGFRTQKDCNKLANLLEEWDKKFDINKYYLQSNLPISKESIYLTGKEDLREFIKFLKNCGGFEIW